MFNWIILLQVTSFNRFTLFSLFFLKKVEYLSFYHYITLAVFAVITL